MKDFGSWIADMAGTIEDASEFSKDMPSTGDLSIRNVMHDWWQQAIQASPMPITTEDEVKDFLSVLTEAFYDYIGWNTWNDADTDEEAVEYFINLKNKVFGLKE